MSTGFTQFVGIDNLMPGTQEARHIPPITNVAVGSPRPRAVVLVDEPVKRHCIVRRYMAQGYRVVSGSIKDLWLYRQVFPRATFVFSEMHPLCSAMVESSQTKCHLVTESIEVAELAYAMGAQAVIGPIHPD